MSVRRGLMRAVDLIALVEGRRGRMEGEMQALLFFFGHATCGILVL